MQNLPPQGPGLWHICLHASLFLQDKFSEVELLNKIECGSKACDIYCQGGSQKIMLTSISTISIWVLSPVPLPMLGINNKNILLPVLQLKIFSLLHYFYYVWYSWLVKIPTSWKSGENADLAPHTPLGGVQNGRAALEKFASFLKCSTHI